MPMYRAHLHRAHPEEPGKHERREGQHVGAMSFGERHGLRPRTHDSRSAANELGNGERRVDPPPGPELRRHAYEVDGLTAVDEHLELRQRVSFCSTHRRERRDLRRITARTPCITANEACFVVSEDQIGLSSRCAVISVDGNYQSAATSAGSSRAQVLPPATQIGDVARAFDGVRLAQEAADLLSIFQINFSDAERCRNPGNETAEVLRGDGPHLHVDRRPTCGDTHQSRPERRPAGQRVKPVRRNGASSSDERRAATRELMIERQPFHVRTAHSHRDGLPARCDGPTCIGTRECHGRFRCSRQRRTERARMLDADAMKAIRKAQQRFIRPRMTDQRDARTADRPRGNRPAPRRPRDPGSSRSWCSKPRLVLRRIGSHSRSAIL